MLTSETLNRAADLIEERDWGRGPAALRGPTGLCIEGAIGAAMFGEVLPSEPYCAIQASPAATALYDHLGVGAGRRFRFAWQWNDHPGRTAAEVVEVLRACAVIEQHCATVPGLEVPA